MVRLARDRELGPRDPLDAVDRTDRDAFGFENGPLLDMELDIGMDRGCADRRRPGIADPAQILADLRPVDSDGAEGVRERHPADIDEASHHVGAEARALLVREEGDGERPPRGNSGLVQGFDNLESREDAEISVVAPAGPDRIDVRARHHRRTLLEPAADTDDVPYGVHRYREPQLLHPADDEIAPRLVLVREGETAHAAALDRAHLRQRVEATEQPVDVDPKICRRVHQRPRTSLAGRPTMRA